MFAIRSKGKGRWRHVGNLSVPTIHPPTLLTHTHPPILAALFLGFNLASCRGRLAKHAACQWHAWIVRLLSTVVHLLSCKYSYAPKTWPTNCLWLIAPCFIVWSWSLSNRRHWLCKCWDLLCRPLFIQLHYWCLTWGLTVLLSHTVRLPLLESPKRPFSAQLRAQCYFIIALIPFPKPSGWQDSARYIWRHCINYNSIYNNNNNDDNNYNLSITICIRLDDN